MRKTPLIVGAAAAALSLAIGAVLVTRFHAPEPPRQAASSGTVTSQAEEGGVTLGGPFDLETTGGARFTDADLAGKPYAIFFGFTYCPDVCPTTLNDLAGWMDALGPQADALRYVFVTVDPERDDIETMTRYAHAFSERIIPLTGTPEEIDAILDAYKIYAAKVPLEDGDYTMNHTAAIYLMGADGGFADVISYKDEAETAVRKLRALAEAAPVS